MVTTNLNKNQEHKEIGICLTGHRPLNLDGYDLNTPFYKRLKYKLEFILEKALKTNDKIICSSGLALGADTIWSMAIFSMKKKHPGRVEFHAHIPNWSHSKKWVSEKDKLFWQKTIENADKIHVADPDEKYSFGVSLNMRNQSMVNMSKVVIAIYNGQENGGTANCIKFARKKNKKVLLIHPNSI